jgi:hypothetical protein
MIILFGERCKKFDYVKLIKCKKLKNIHSIIQLCSFYDDVQCPLMKEQLIFKKLNIHSTIHIEGLLHPRGDMVYTTLLPLAFIYRRAPLNV